MLKCQNHGQSAEWKSKMFLVWPNLNFRFWDHRNSPVTKHPDVQYTWQYIFLLSCMYIPIKFFCAHIFQYNLIHKVQV